MNLISSGEIIRSTSSELKPIITQEKTYVEILREQQTTATLLSSEPPNTIFMNNLYSKHQSQFASVTGGSILESRLYNIPIDSYRFMSSDTLVTSAYNFGSKKKHSISKHELIDDRNLLMVNMHFPGTSVLESGEIVYNRFACAFDVNENFGTVFEALRYNIFVFIIELFRGTLEESHRLLLDFRLTKHFISRAINNPIQYSALSKISPRYPVTGFLKKRVYSVILFKGQKIIITADRKFAQLGSKNVIYINCLTHIRKLQPGDYILLDTIRLKVIEQVNISAMCEIICGGILKRGIYVKFPKHSAMEFYVTPEEIADIKYSQAEKINCIILPTCDCGNYFKSIQNLLKTFNFNYCRLFAIVYAFEVESMEQAKLIADTYDGLNLYIYRTNSKYNNNMIQLPDVTKHLIEQFYFQRKPILIGQFFVGDKFAHESIVIHPDSEKHILYYPDKYVLKVTQLKYYFVASYVKILESNKFNFIEFALADLSLSPIEINLTSESDIFARSVIKTAYDCNAKCIILSSKSGRMAAKISHFRPNVPIITLCDNLNIVRYLSIYHNIWMVYYNSNQEHNLLKLSLTKMVCGVLYAVSHNILEEGHMVVYVYKPTHAYSFPNKMAVMKMSDELLTRIVQNY